MSVGLHSASRSLQVSESSSLSSFCFQRSFEAEVTKTNRKISENSNREKYLFYILYIFPTAEGGVLLFWRTNSLKPKDTVNYYSFTKKYRLKHEEAAGFLLGLRLSWPSVGRVAAFLSGLNPPGSMFWTKPTCLQGVLPGSAVRKQKFKGFCV